MPTTTLPNANDHVILLQTAIDMTTLYRTNRETILDTSYKGKGILPLSETFNRGAIDALLAVTNCAGIRIYYGMDEDDKVHAVLVAVNSSNEDLLPGNSLEENEDPIIVELGQRCPPTCPPTSDLND